MPSQAKQRVYVGTYTRRSEDQPHRPESIYICEFDANTGTLELRDVISNVPNPSYLAVSKDGNRLFAVNEESSFNDASGGGVSSIAIGEAPCYITLDAAEKWALVANYTGGNLTVFPIMESGQLEEAAFIHQNHGHSVNTERQESAHAHCVIFDPEEHYVLAADLGMDQVQVFRFDPITGQLMLHSAVDVVPGAGPRHLLFHPNGRLLYVINELNFSIGVYDYAVETGKLLHKQTLSVLPDDFEGRRWGADIHITRSGKFLYASNRGYDCIATIAVSPQDGTLALIETVPSGGKTPRNFALDLTENYLLVAHQDSDSLIVFEIDQDTGRLTQTGNMLNVPLPVCLKVVE